MLVDVLLTPREIRRQPLTNRVAVVFDVLRATTTMVAALAAGATEIHLLESLDVVMRMGFRHRGGAVMGGERNCLRPPGFQLGNSPGDYTADQVAGKTIFMCTTNGTAAIAAAQSARRICVAALVNAAATAKHLAATGMDATLVCAGTNGEPAPEDLIGAGAVVSILQKTAPVELSNVAQQAMSRYHQASGDLAGALRATQGGKNVVAAGLERDIDFAARLNVFDVVVQVSANPPIARICADKPGL